MRRICVKLFASHLIWLIESALSLAMARDGSSGGVVRLCTIDKEGVERKWIPGDKLPRVSFEG